MAAMTEKQAMYRDALIAQNLAAIAQKINATHYRAEKADLIARAALIVNLPTPADRMSASEQIDALKSGGVVSLARRQGWGQRIMEALAARIGQDQDAWVAAVETADWLATEYRRGGIVEKVVVGKMATADTLKAGLKVS